MNRVRRHLRREQRGQSLLEMTMILPVFLLLVLGTLEFGMAFDHNLTLEYASREGVRTGSALANGGGPLGCGAGQSPNAATVDNQIIAAVERVLTSSGSPIDITNVTQIRIYQVATGNPNGNEVAGSVNRWVPGSTAATSTSPALLFQKDLAVQGWAACSRQNGAGADSIGVGINYTYNFQTPLGSLLSMVKIDMHDQTVMQLNPTGK
jgi:hypothetical protein